MGRMKSLAYDYAIYLADNQDDPDVIFNDIVNGLIRIPQWFVDSWVQENPIFAAETNSWKQQKRDAKGRFTKGFAQKTDKHIREELAEKEQEEEEYQEYVEEQIAYHEMIEPYSQFVDVEVPLEITPEKLSVFISTAVQDDEFPERMTDPYFFQYLQKIAEGVDFRVLERLHDALEMQQNMAHHMGEGEMEIIGGRGAFITGILMNIKTGQEAWAAEDGETQSFEADTLEDCEEREDGWMEAVAELEDYLEWFVANSSKSKIKEFNKYRFDPNYTFEAEDDKKPVGIPMELGKPLEWTPYDEKVSIFSRKRAENSDNDFDPEINLMRFELVESEMENIDYNYLYDLLLHGTPGWANLSDDEVREEYQRRFER